MLLYSNIHNTTIDFEQNKYRVLALLQKSKENFSEKKVFPFYHELRELREELEEINTQQTHFLNRTKSLSGIDFQHQKLEYKSDESFVLPTKEVVQIIEFSLPRLRTQIQKGEEIIEESKNLITIEPLGIIPQYNQEGYLFYHTEGERKLDIFQYTVSLYEHSQSAIRSIKTEFIRSFSLSISNTFEKAKALLLQEKKCFSVPATYLISATRPIPFEETLQPISKMLFSGYLFSPTVSQF